MQLPPLVLLASAFHFNLIYAYPFEYESPHNTENGDCSCVLPQKCAMGPDAEEHFVLDPRIYANSSGQICAAPLICCDKDLLVDSLRCGMRHEKPNVPRIVTSEQIVSRFADWPWHAAILRLSHRGTVFVCSGALVDSMLVLTAAHCLTNHQKRTFYVRLGEWDTQSASEPIPHQDHSVERVLVHPNYNETNLWNDIAILVLSEPATFRENILPVCLIRNTLIQTFDCVVTGWGKNAHEGGNYSAVLKETSMSIIEFERCQAQLRQTRLGHRFRLHPSFVCAGGLGHSDTCKGDGGGPLVCRGFDGLFYLTGLVSWGIGCGNAAAPGLYTFVGRFVNWIDRIEVTRH